MAVNSAVLRADAHVPLALISARRARADCGRPDDPCDIYRPSLPPGSNCPPHSTPSDCRDVKKASIEGTSQPGPQAFGVAMTGLFEDLKRLPPQFASGLPVTGRLVRVAEIDQDLGPGPDPAEVFVDSGRLPIAADRCLVLAAQVPYVAETVPGGRSDYLIVKLLSQSQAALAVGQAAIGVATPGFEPADCVERGGQPRPLLAEQLKQFAGLERVADCTLRGVHEVQQAGQVHVGASLTIDVLQLRKLLKATLQVGMGFVVSA